MVDGDKGKDHHVTDRWDAMRHKKLNCKGQYIIEYATLVVLISAALVAMSTYVYRSVQSTQQMIQQELDNDGDH